MRTRRTAPAEDIADVAAIENDAQSSDDEAPEEVSLAASKQSAAASRKEQQHARQEVQRQAKAQRRKQQQKQEAEPDPASLSHPSEVLASQQPNDENPEDDLDYLPEDILQALAEQPPPTKQQEQQAVVTAQLRDMQHAQKQRKRKEFLERDVGPVKVQVLSKVGNMEASEAAKSFLQQRLHSRLKRTSDMLRPTKYQNSFTYEPKLPPR